MAMAVAMHGSGSDSSIRILSINDLKHDWIVREACFLSVNLPAVCLPTYLSISFIQTNKTVSHVFIELPKLRLWIPKCIIGLNIFAIYKSKNLQTQWFYVKLWLSPVADCHKIPQIEFKRTLKRPALNQLKCVILLFESTLTIESLFHLGKL
jgi:hypothetical protein